jgi:beta-N-acetylhexosaminidase
VTAVVDAVRSGDLLAERLEQAAQRVGAATERLAALRAGAVPAADAQASRLAARRALFVRRPFDPLAGAQVIRLEAGSNQAVGAAPWGLPRQGPVLGRRPPIDVHEGDPLPDLTIGGSVVVLVRDAARHVWVQQALRAITAQRPDAVVVEMGWPDPADGYASVLTWGASAVSAEALDQLLAEGA